MTRVQRRVGLVPLLSVTVATVTAAGCLWSSAAGATGGCGAGSLKLSVQGRGSVTATPNLLTLDLEVSASANTPGQALESDDTATSAVVGALTAGGLASRDIQSTDLSVEPTYADTGEVVTGYEADTTVVAKIRQFSSAGQLIDQAVSAGGTGTSIDSLTFSLTNPLSAQDRARGVAVHRAVSHAASLAAAAGEQLGQLCSLKDQTTTTSTGPPPPLPVYAKAGSVATAPAEPIESGTQTVTAQVMVVYALVPRASHHHRSVVVAP